MPGLGGATQLSHTDECGGRPTWFGSPVSTVAPRLSPRPTKLEALRVMAAAKSSAKARGGASTRTRALLLLTAEMGLATPTLYRPELAGRTFIRTSVELVSPGMFCPFKRH